MKQLLYLISRKQKTTKSHIKLENLMYFHINDCHQFSTYFLNLISSHPCLYSVIFHTGLSSSSISSLSPDTGTSPKLNNLIPLIHQVYPCLVFKTSALIILTQRSKPAFICMTQSNISIIDSSSGYSVCLYLDYYCEQGFYIFIIVSIV